MSVTGLSGLPTSGAQYDFTNLTRQQVLKAGGDLYKQGKITEQENATLIGFAVDYAPVAGQQLSVENGLDSQVSRNYLQLIQNNIASLQGATGGDSDLEKSLVSSKDLLLALTTYQNQTRGASTYREAIGTLLNQQA